MEAFAIFSIIYSRVTTKDTATSCWIVRREGKTVLVKELAAAAAATALY